MIVDSEKPPPAGGGILRSGASLAVDPLTQGLAPFDACLLDSCSRPCFVLLREPFMAAKTKPPVSLVLIADDNHQNCELLDAYLSGEGYEIEMAYDGQQALDAISKRQPDLLLLDIMMPRLSGYEVCQRLKSDPRTRDIPVLMVTALAEMSDIERAVDAGADDFLTKPVNKLELTTRVRSLLRVRHLTSERDRLLQHLENVEALREVQASR